MADPTPTTFTVTCDSRTGEFSFSPSSADVLLGGKVTLVAVNGDDFSVVAKLASDDEPYEPLGPSPYTATSSGKEYELQPDVLDTGYLTVESGATSPTGTIVPVVPMAFTTERFTPETVDVRPGGKILLTWGERQPSEVTVQTFDPSGDAFPLFGGASNSYRISDSGTLLTVPDDVDVEDGYSIESDQPGDPQVPVRGTINVKR